MVRVILDTCILYSALRSSTGASFRIISALPSKKFQMVVSTPVFFEYEEVLHRPNFTHLTARDIDDFLDFIASVCDRCQVNFLWRPVLPDPDDDLILEAAVSGGVDAIITYNQKDFIGCEQFAVRVISPSDFIKELHI